MYCTCNVYVWISIERWPYARILLIKNDARVTTHIDDISSHMHNRYVKKSAPVTDPNHLFCCVPIIPSLFIVNFFIW